MSTPVIAYLYPSELGGSPITFTCHRVSGTHPRTTCPEVPTGLRGCSHKQTAQISQASCASANVTGDPQVLIVDHMVFCPSCKRRQCSHWATPLPEGLAGTISSHCTLARVLAPSLPGEARGACPVSHMMYSDLFLVPNSHKSCHKACPHNGLCITIHLFVCQAETYNVSPWYSVQLSVQIVRGGLH